MSALVLSRSLEPAVHPAARRLMAERLPPPPAHEIVLQPLGGGDATTVIVTSAARDMLGSLFEDLQASDWRDRLAQMRRLRVDPANVLELSQPIHRRFQIALFEAACARPGDPRLDPKKIAGSGVVLRRLDASGARQGWMKRGKTPVGWQTLGRPLDDPDPAQAAVHPANAAIRAAIAAHAGKPAVPLAEDVQALYPAPPDVCAALGRTVLYSVLSVVSSETAEAASAPVDYQALSADTRGELVDHFSEYLKPRAARALPHAGEVLDGAWNAMAPNAEAGLGKLGLFLYQAMSELDALGTGQAAAALMARLAGIALPTALDAMGQVTQSVDAASFVRRAAPILVGGDANPDGYRMPLSWPTLSTETGNALTEAALACLTEAQTGRIGLPAKFAQDDDLYLVRAFLRVKGDEGCPDKLVWSTTESEPFRVLPWWDGEGPGTTIALPDLGKLKKVKPSVAFSMPPAIAKVLQGDMKALASGDGSPPSDGLTIGWLCSFSIPFITICAFIVLNIFLSLFNIVFGWLLFIKLCIPIPMPKSAAKPSGGGG